MPQPPFLRLQDVVLPPPLPAIVEIAMVAGVAYLGCRIAIRLRGDKAEALDFAAGFVAVVAIAAGVLHGLALANLTPLAVLRPIGWGLGAVGAFAMVRHRARIVAVVRHEIVPLWQAPALDRAAVVVAALSVLGLGLAALGPPTDADSLDYHLGLALEWLRHGGVIPRPDWYPSRLAGITESVNMLGLAAGTDGLGGGLQLRRDDCSGRGAALVRGDAARSIAAGRIASCPVSRSWSRTRSHRCCRRQE